MAKRTIEKHLEFIFIDGDTPDEACMRIQQAADQYKAEWPGLEIRVEGDGDEGGDVSLYGVRDETDEEAAAREQAEQNRERREYERLKAKFEHAATEAAGGGK